MEKQEFLIVYDYGPGGLWGVMNAHNEDEIKRKYPELEIIHDRPKWLTEERLKDLRDREWHDIDGIPWGILNVIIEERYKR